jgi:hypothetical protein
MLPYFSQYSPPGPLPPFSGTQGIGQSPGFGGAGAYGQGFYTQPGASYAQPGGTFGTALQVIPLIGHLAQQIHLHSGMTQQIGIALNHLAQQLAVLSQQVMLSQQVQGGTGLGFGASQGLAGGQPFGTGQGAGQAGWQNGPFAPGAQPYGFTPFAGASGLGGQTPWAAQRSQTIQ